MSLPKVSEFQVGEWNKKLLKIEGPALQFPFCRSYDGVVSMYEKLQISVQVTPDVCGWIKDLENEIKTKLILSHNFSINDIEELEKKWKSNLWNDRLRLKVDACSFFNDDKVAIETPLTDPTLEYLFRVEVPSVWMMNDKIGLVWKGTQCIVRKRQVYVTPKAGTFDMFRDVCPAS